MAVDSELICSVWAFKTYSLKCNPGLFSSNDFKSEMYAVYAELKATTLIIPFHYQIKKHQR